MLPARDALVTIGVPVYNGERFLAQCLDSLLAQDFTDYTLLISDNASSDATRDIARSYCARDGRIRYHRHDSNIGLYGNLNYLLRSARSEYVKLANSDDYWAPTMLSAAVAQLERDPDVVLCYPMMIMVDAEGRQLGRYDHGPHVMDDDPVRRFMAVLQELRLVNQLTGVMRTSSVQRAMPLLDQSGADAVLIAELSLSGKICQLPDYHYYRRFHEHSSSYDRVSAEHQLRYVYADDVVTPHHVRWEYHLGLIRSVLHSNLGLRGKFASLMFLLRRMNWDRAALFSELKQGVRSRRA